MTLGITPRINFNQAGIKTSGLHYKVDYNEQDINSDEDEYVQTYSGAAYVGLPAEINPNALDNGELVLDEGLLPENWLEDMTPGSFLKNP